MKGGLSMSVGSDIVSAWQTDAMDILLVKIALTQLIAIPIYTVIQAPKLAKLPSH